MFKMFPFKVLLFILIVYFSDGLDFLNSPEARAAVEENKAQNFNGFGFCSTRPCKNGGTCELGANGTSFKCYCADPYYGKTCDFSRKCDPCQNHPCRSGAKCYVVGNEAKCNCPEPYFGEICERSPCPDNPCKNNGTCFIEDGKTKCSCIGFFNGELCENTGCFHGSSIVLTKSGEKMMKLIQIGDEVASGFESDGSLKFSEVIAFLHKDQEMVSSFIQLETESTSPLLITKKHLLYRVADQQGSEAIYADQIKVGDLVYTRDVHGVSPSLVTRVNYITMAGVYAPLTLDGTILVNDILASCYAEVDSHDKAHLAFFPLRLHYYLMSALKSFDWLWSNSENSIQGYESSQEEVIVCDKTKVIEKIDSLGIHWYPKMLCWLSNYDCK